MRKLQIGIMGSSADLKYSQELTRIAKEIGVLLAREGIIIFFGAEKDYDSLSTVAARAARSIGGSTIGVTYNLGKKIFDQSSAEAVVVTGLERGGGREFSLVASCDAIIALGGGSGTLTEIAQAYQLDVPIIVIQGTGGWSDKLAGKFLDKRKRRKIESVNSAKEATLLAVSLAREKVREKINKVTYNSEGEKK